VRQRWRWAVAILLVAVAVRYALHFPWLDTWNALASADLGLLAAAATANLLSLACKAGGWHLLLRDVAQVRVRTTQAATFAGAAVGSVGIAMSGEAARLHLLNTRDGVPASTVARSIAASRVLEAAGLGVFLLLLAAGQAALYSWRFVAGALVLGSAALAVLMWLRGGRRNDELLLALTFTVAAWLLQWATYYLAIAATHTAVTRGNSALALLLSNLGGIFRLTPGNVGVLQGAIILSLAPAGVPAAAALAAGLALQGVLVLPVVAIGLVILGRHELRRVRAAS
jgi:uncharacterized membrane protein YbhN (UPF0104 family)